MPACPGISHHLTCPGGVLNRAYRNIDTNVDTNIDTHININTNRYSDRPHHPTGGDSIRGGLAAAQ